MSTVEISILPTTPCSYDGDQNIRINLENAQIFEGQTVTISFDEQKSS